MQYASGDANLPWGPYVVYLGIVLYIVSDYGSRCLNMLHTTQYGTSRKKKKSEAVLLGPSTSSTSSCGSTESCMQEAQTRCN